VVAKRTWVAPVRPLPDTVTDVPPVDGPDDGPTVVTTGAGADAAAGTAAMRQATETDAMVDTTGSQRDRRRPIGIRRTPVIVIPIFRPPS
jgi:hypothetical protein